MSKNYASKLSGPQVFQILPTGFGKKSKFSIIATACTERLVTLWKLERDCVLVVSSLVSVMKDQVNWRVDTFMPVMTPLQSRRFQATLQRQQQQYTSHKPKKIISVVKGAELSVTQIQATAQEHSLFQVSQHV